MNGMSSSAQPLKGRTVVITRAQGQSDELASALEKLGAAVIRFPTIQIVEPSSWAPLDAAIEKLDSYDWVVFTSANGVRYFFRRLSECRRQLGRQIICAIGPATAKALDCEGVRADLTARDSRAEGVLKAIIEYVGGEQKLRALRFLMPRAQIARELLPTELRRLGAQVDAVEAYRNVMPDVDKLEAMKLFKQRSVDAITFTSPSTVSNFAALFGKRDLSELLAGVVVACIGPVTAATAAEYGLKNLLRPETQTAAALARALVEALSASG
jgi:uroporphyrinogen III methyltransferase/synthase